MYQDNFNEGIYTGKGIYNLQTFSSIITNQIPENLVLSHDLLEGSYLRCGLASDILLLDGFPSKYNSYMVRQKRWIRGDWQILQWIKSKIMVRNGTYELNPLNLLSRYKIFDNLRRSLVPISIFLCILIGMLTTKTQGDKIIIAGLISIAMPLILNVMDRVVLKKEIENGFVVASKNFQWKIGGVKGMLYQTFLELSVLPYNAYISMCAITKTIYRLFISKQNMLEWLTAEEAEKQAITAKLAYYRQMIINVISGGILLFFCIQGSLIQRIIGLIIGLMWISGPAIVCIISRPTVKENPVSKIQEDERKELISIAKKTWSFFSSYINEQYNYLPPDNYEEARSKKIAPRTSPTNIGLGLLSIVSALDFKFITLEEGINLIEKSLNSIDKLEKWNGHLYNWYDIETLEPLNPKYISSVDSGNFVGYLYVLKAFLSEIKDKKADKLINTINQWINNTNFAKLYDQKKKLFSVGFNIEDGKLTDSYYDLLASESRQMSLIAIAKKDVSVKHWSALNRTLTVYKKFKGLVSWSGTSFEYLMPNIIIRNYPGSLLEESCKFMVLCQKEYCNKLNIPWGISEAGFSLKDLFGNYQYKAFGIPWLGLKRGLSSERVVSSYGSILAITDYPREVMDNIKLLEKENMRGEFGLYESIDYTPTRLKINQKYEIVKTYMAHHQGLILISINNFFHDNIMVERFMKNPEIESVDILLQERMPQLAVLTKEKKERIEKIHVDDYETYSQRVYTKPNPNINRTNVISSDNYTIFMDEFGKGFSKYNNLLINRFNEDSDLEQGVFFYLKNVRTKQIWSDSNLKCVKKPDKYRILFMPDSNIIYRYDGNIETKTKITIAPEEPVELRTIEIKNTGNKDEIIELTSVLEPVLSNKEQDSAHPAFNGLFLNYEWLSKVEAILVRRNKRRKDESNVYMGVSLYNTDAEILGEIEYDVDKNNVLGRCNIGIPEKIQKSTLFLNRVNCTPESIVALKKTIKINPGETAKIALIITVSYEKQDVIERLEKYRNIEKIERSFELARAKNEAENRYLNIKDTETDLYQKMLGYLLLQNQLKSIDSKKLPKEIYSQEELWKLGISGDIPMIVAKIKDANDSHVISDLLKAKEFFILKNCDVDIVIINEEKNAYEQYTKEKIENAIFERHLEYLVGKENGIYIINSNNIDKHQKNSLIFRSNITIDAGKGNLKEQLEEMEENYIEQKTNIGFEKEIQGKELSKGQLTIDSKNLKFYNGYGGFALNGNEYTLKTNEENKLPTVWAHVLANKHFGTVVTDNLGGFTWNENSRLNRLTSWNNMPCMDIPSEILYFKEAQSGKLWSNSSFTSGSNGDFKTTYSFGYASFTNMCNDFFCETLIFVPKEDKVKVTIVKLKNTKAEKRKLKVFYYLKPVLGENEEKNKTYIDLKYKDSHVLEARNLANNTFKDILFLGTNLTISSYTGDKKEFIGNGTIINPEGTKRVSLSNENSLGRIPCIVFESEIDFEGYESKEFSIFVGEAENEPLIGEYEKKYIQTENCYQELSNIKNYWFEQINRLQVNTPIESMNIMLNGWLIYQTLCCRLWARSGYYQSGGAYGFRDQLQDTLSLKFTAPEYIKEQILKACAHQFLEGDVEHWWHDETNKGIRTRFSDDLLWLPYTLAEYVNVTGDNSILDEEVEFLKGECLDEKSDEKYNTYLGSNIYGSVYEHAIKAIDKGISLGINGLPKIGSGDWNDGLNTVGNKGIGESVWLGFFLYDVLQKFISICILKDDREKTSYYKLICDGLKKSLNAIGWDGRWFRRAFTDDGDVLGSIENEECKIDSISQSWAVMSNAGDNDKKFIAMESLENYLVDKENGIIKLLTPPFEKSKLEPGYIKSYMPGVRENGGQYTHAAAWTIIAETQLGFGQKAVEYFKMINPIEHAKTKDEANKYKVEPYVVAGDVYGEGVLAGHGGWTWYTGSSGWLYQAGIEHILGLKIIKKELTVLPCIPKDWQEYSMRYRYKNTIYNIRVKNPNGKETGISKFMVNGKEIPEHKISLDESGNTYEIEVEM
ncbi:MAG: hypothetical protein IKP28_02510 [Clostridia bacterium]|nr:hypothetical protein [Clostridia bacterium]